MVLQAYKSALARIGTETDHAIKFIGSLDRSRYGDLILKYVKIDKPWQITINAAYKDALVETSASFEKRSNERRSVFYAGGGNSKDSCFKCGGKGHHQNLY